MRTSLMVAIAAFMAGTSMPGLAAVEANPMNVLRTTRASDVIVLAHRACWHTAPENSIAAIEACHTLGVDMVEIDVRRSKDGQLVVMHDESVDRTTNGRGAVTDLTGAEIRALRLRHKDGGLDASITDQHVPSVEEALIAARGKVKVNLHLKSAAQAEVAQLVRRLGMVGQVTTWVAAAPNSPSLTSSPLRGAIGIIPTIDDCRLGYAAPCWPAQINSLNNYATITPVAFFLDFRQTYDFIRSIAVAPRPLGTRIFVETLNRIDNLPPEKRHAEWQWLINAEVTVIMTNEPEDLITFLRSSSHAPLKLDEARAR